MIRKRTLKAGEFLNCSSCGVDKVDLTVISASKKIEDANWHRIDLCKKCLNELKTLINDN